MVVSSSNAANANNNGNANNNTVSNANYVAAINHWNGDIQMFQNPENKESQTFHRKVVNMQDDAARYV